MEKTLKQLEILFMNGVIDSEEFHEIKEEYIDKKEAAKRIEESTFDHVKALMYTKISESEYGRIKERLEKSKQNRKK